MIIACERQLTRQPTLEMRTEDWQQLLRRAGVYTCLRVHNRALTHAGNTLNFLVARPLPVPRRESVSRTHVAYNSNRRLGIQGMHPVRLLIHICRDRAQPHVAEGARRLP